MSEGARSGRGILQIPQVAPTKKRPKPLSSEPWMANGDALRELEAPERKVKNNKKTLEAPERKVKQKLDTEYPESK